MKNFIVIACLLGCAFIAHAQQNEILTNTGVVNLVKNGFSEPVIITKINNSACSFNLSTDSMIALKKHGVTDNELNAMIAAKATKIAPTPTPIKPQIADDIHRQPEEKKPALKIKPKTFFVIGGGLSVSNKFAVGNAEQSYEYLTGNDGTTMNQGTTGFDYVTIGMETRNGKMAIGVNVSYDLYSSHALWGTTAQYGYGVNVHYQPQIFSSSIKIGGALIDRGMKSTMVYIEPALLLAKMNGLIGTYNSINGDVHEVTESGAFNLGWSAALDIDVPIMKAMNIELRAGYRSLIIPETHADATSATGYKSYYVTNSTSSGLVKVNFSGVFATVGVNFLIGKK